MVFAHCQAKIKIKIFSILYIVFNYVHFSIAEESRSHTVLCDKYPHLRQIKCSQFYTFGSTTQYYTKRRKSGTFSKANLKFSPSVFIAIQILRGNRNGYPIFCFRCWLPISSLIFLPKPSFQAYLINIHLPKSVKIAVSIYRYRFFLVKRKGNYRRFSNLKAFSLNSFVRLQANPNDAMLL